MARDGRCEHVAILFVVGHLVLDRIGCGLVEHRVGKGRKHRCPQALPLLWRQCALFEQVSASLVKDALGPEWIEGALGRDPQQQAA